MTYQSEIKPGDVVLGAFATDSGRVLNHYSVVLQVVEGGCLLAYTTSLKDKSFRGEQRFTMEDMMAANWSEPCRWDATCVSVVPHSRIRRTGKVTRQTFNKIMKAHMDARQRRSVTIAMLNEHGKVVVSA